MIPPDSELFDSGIIKRICCRFRSVNELMEKKDKCWNSILSIHQIYSCLCACFCHNAMAISIQLLKLKCRQKEKRAQLLSDVYHCSTIILFSNF